MLLISSEHEEVLGLAHRVLVMRGGRIVAELDRHDDERGRAAARGLRDRDGRTRRPAAMSTTGGPRGGRRAGERAPCAGRPVDRPRVRDRVRVPGALHHALGLEQRLPDEGQPAQPRLPGGADRDPRLRRGARLHRRRLRPLGRRDRLVLGGDRRQGVRRRRRPALAGAHPRRADRARLRDRERHPGHARPGERVHRHPGDELHRLRDRRRRHRRLPASRSAPSRGRRSGWGTAGTINYPIFVWIAFALFCGFLLSRTALGRYIYAVRRERRGRPALRRPRRRRPGQHVRDLGALGRASPG